MIGRREWALLVVLVFGAMQVLALTAPTALLLAKPGNAGLEATARTMVAGPMPMLVGTAVVAALLPGTLVALAVWLLRFWGLTAGVMLAPLLLPIAWLAPGAGPAATAVQFAGHASLGLGFGACCGLLGLLGVDRGVLRAAQCCGVSRLGAVRRVLLPLMAPGILAGVLLAAIASLATCVVRQIQGVPLPLAALPTVPAALWSAAGGLAVLICAMSGVAVLLLRRA